MENKTTFNDVIKCLKVGRKICPEYIIASFIQSIIQSVLPFVGIIFSYLILDGLINRINNKTIYLYVGLLIGITLILSLFLKLCNFFISKYNNIISYRINKAISDKVYTLDYEQVEDSETMDLLQKARDGSNSNGGLSGIFSKFFNSVFTPLLQFIYSIILLSGLFISSKEVFTDSIAKFINNPLSTLVIILALILSTVVSLVITKIMNKESYKAMITNIDANRRFSYMYSICTNYQYGKDIRLFGMQPMIMSILNNTKSFGNNTWRAVSIKFIKYQIIANVFAKLLLFISYAYVGIKAYYGIISIGNVVSYVSAITLLGTSIDSILEGYVYIKQQASYLKHYFTYLNLPTKMEYGTLDFNDTDAKIEFKNVSFVYPKQPQDTINNVSFTINKGEKIALVGQNGAGKTTIIKLLCRLYDVTDGEILINDINIKNYKRESLYKVFSVVFQDFKIFSYSIKDNIDGGSLQHDDNKIWLSLDKAGIKDRVEKMDDKLDTILYQKNNDNGVEISGGEAQKIAIARALYKDSPLVILDEPTSALDPIAEADIYSRFKDMVNNKTSIFISHRMSSCKFCDKIIVLEKGKIEEIGSHNELINNNRLYKTMWDSQAKYYN